MQPDNFFPKDIIAEVFKKFNPWLVRIQYKNTLKIHTIIDMPTKFRKKPVVIEAMQFNCMDSYLKIVEWMKNCGDTFALANEVKYSHPTMLIQTLEGTMAVNPTDWVIKGVKNEFYPCKNEIFVETYDECD